MADSVRIIGIDPLIAALGAVSGNLKNPELVTLPLTRSAKEFAHVDTGYMRAHIFPGGWNIYATAPYAGTEADRGGSHDFGERAIQAFDVEKYIDHLMEPF